jgi:hypothetical protein
MADNYLHAVLIRKPMSLPMARKTAQQWIGNRNRRLYKETDDWYLFRNLPYKFFDGLLHHEVNENIILLYGGLKNYLTPA